MKSKNQKLTALLNQAQAAFIKADQPKSLYLITGKGSYFYTVTILLIDYLDYPINSEISIEEVDNDKNCRYSENVHELFAFFTRKQITYEKNSFIGVLKFVFGFSILVILAVFPGVVFEWIQSISRYYGYPIAITISIFALARNRRYLRYI